MAIPDDLVELVRASARIEEVVAHRVQVGPVKRGVALCLCPFHDDKTPSLRLDTRENRYKCWSCGASGNAIQFVMDYDRVTFPEALHTIAAEAGMDLEAMIRARAPAPSESEKAARLLKRNMYKAMAEAHAAYRASLASSAEATAYLRAQRGLSETVIEAFQLGYAPDDFGFISRKTLRADWLKEAALEAGLCQKSDNGHQYDLLRGRITYPFLNEKGEPIAFSARNFGDTEGKGPKYLNTADSPLFFKSKCVFGLYQSKSLAREKDFWIVSEGQHDVISAWAHGLPAAGGSTNHISEDQARLLFRHARELVMVLDGDTAGRDGLRASLLNIAGLLSADRYASVVCLPAGQDLDGLLEQKGLDGFTPLFESRASFSDFVTAQAVEAAHGTVGGEALPRAVRELRVWAEKIADGAVLAGVVQKTAEALSLPFETLDALVAGGQTDDVARLEQLIRDEPVMTLIYAGAIDKAAQARIAGASLLQEHGGAREVVLTLLEELAARHCCTPSDLTVPLHANLEELRPFGAVVGSHSPLLMEIAGQATTAAIALLDAFRPEPEAPSPAAHRELAG